jgi:hypothetical protein
VLDLRGERLVNLVIGRGGIDQRDTMPMPTAFRSNDKSIVEFAFDGGNPFMGAKRVEYFSFRVVAQNLHPRGLAGRHGGIDVGRL